MGDLLTIEEVASITKLHEMTIRRYIRHGKLDAVRVGRQLRVRREALDAFMQPVAPAATGDEEPGLTEDDPLWAIVGIGHADVTDLSANKYHYLAEIHDQRA